MEVPLLVVVPRLVAPLVAVPPVVVRLLVAPLLVAPLLVDPEPVDPVFVDPVLADPLFPLPEVVSDGLVPPEPLPEPGELDAGVAGVEVLLPGVEVLLAGAGEDEDAVALALAVLDGLAVGDRQPVPVALARVALVLAFADAVEVAVPVAVVLAVPVAGVVAVAAVLSPGLVPPPAGLPPVPPPVALPVGPLAGLLTGVTLGVTDREAGVAGVAAAEDGEADTHGAVASWLLCAAEVPPGPAAPGAEPTWVPSPFVLGTPPPVLELEIPTAEPSWTKASRSGGTARATPMANTAQAAASAGRSSPYRQSRC